MIARADARRRLRAARTVWRQRPAHPTLRDHAYLVYVTLLVIVLVAVPLVRAVVLALTQPASLALLAAPGAAVVVSVSGAVVWVGAVALGRQRGPVVPPPFVAQTLGDSDLPPRAVWGGRALRALSVAVVALTAIATLAHSGLIATGLTAFGMSFIAGAALFAIPAAVLWLAGQALPRRAATAIAAVLAAWGAVGLVTSAVPTPWGMLATLWSDAAVAALFAAAVDGSASVAVLTDAPPIAGLAADGVELARLLAGTASALPLLVLASFAVVAAVCAPLCAARLDAQVVRAHARRWETMTLLARTGDLAGAAGGLRPPPAVGRRWRMPLTAPLSWATVQRDAVAAARNPARTLAALVAIAAAGALWGWLPGLPTGLTWVAGLPAALLCFAGLGALCDGVREAVDSVGRPALFRQSPGRLLALHLTFPALAGLLVAAAAALIAGGPWIVAAAMALFVLAVRVMDAAKPPLPIGLLMPVPTPAGDASGMFVTLWQADAVLVAAAAGIWLAPALAAGPAGAIWLLAAFVAVAAVTITRVRGASS